MQVESHAWNTLEIFTKKYVFLILVESWYVCVCMHVYINRKGSSCKTFHLINVLNSLNYATYI